MMASEAEEALRLRMLDEGLDEVKVTFDLGADISDEDVENILQSIEKMPEVEDVDETDEEGKTKSWQYKREQPRVPAGSSDGGQFAPGGGGGGGDGGGGSTTAGEPASPESDHAAAVLDQWSTPATGSRSGDYAEIRQQGVDWAKGENNKGFDDLYSETQGRVNAMGIKEVTAFRGVEIPGDHPLAVALSEGKLSEGSSFASSGMELASWSEKSDVATRFADSPLARAERRVGKRSTIGVVLERTIKAADLVSGEKVHKGFIEGESEWIAKNSGKSSVRIVGFYK